MMIRWIRWIRWIGFCFYMQGQHNNTKIIIFSLLNLEPAFNIEIFNSKMNTPTLHSRNELNHLILSRTQCSLLRLYKLNFLNVNTLILKCCLCCSLKICNFWNVHSLIKTYSLFPSAFFVFRCQTLQMFSLWVCRSQQE